MGNKVFPMSGLASLLLLPVLSPYSISHSFSSVSDRVMLTGPNEWPFHTLLTLPETVALP